MELITDPPVRLQGCGLPGNRVWAVLLLLGLVWQGSGQVPTSRDPTPWGAAIGRRGPAGAEDMIWAQLGHSAEMGKVRNRLDVLRQHQIEASDQELAAGTYKPDLDAPTPRVDVPRQLAALLKSQAQALREYPLLAAVWSNPPEEAIAHYVGQQYRAYQLNLQLIGERTDDLATACSHLVEMEYRVLDPHHGAASAEDRIGFRGTCIASIARAEKMGTLMQPETRGALAETLAIVAEGYNDRLRYSRTRPDAETERELMRFVAFDFEQTFHVAPTRISANEFPCVLLDDAVSQCAAGLPTLKRVLTQVVAGNR